MNRYQSHSVEAEYEPGSDGLVLRNRAGIVSVDDMNELELELLAQLYEDILLKHLPERQLTAGDLKHWHRRWLGNVYAWAGQERTVNLSKNGFAFAAAAQIPSLLDNFEHSVLRRWTPCRGMETDQLMQALAITHVELILIHPFREGNGRLSRLLADVMAVQAGREPLDYSAWETHKSAYISAIHHGVSRDYAPMRRCMAQAMGL